MPIYVYRCNECVYQFEEMQKMYDQPLVICPSCQKQSLVKVFSQTAPPVFKGGGFYDTDYGGKKPK